MRFGRSDDGAGGFELPAEGAELPVLARGQQIGRFVLEPTPGVVDVPRASASSPSPSPTRSAPLWTRRTVAPLTGSADVR